MYKFDVLKKHCRLRTESHSAGDIPMSHEDKIIHLHDFVVALFAGLVVGTLGALSIIALGFIVKYNIDITTCCTEETLEILMNVLLLCGLVIVISMIGIIHSIAKHMQKEPIRFIMSGLFVGTIAFTTIVSRIGEVLSHIH